MQDSFQTVEKGARPQAEKIHCGVGYYPTETVGRRAGVGTPYRG